MITASLAQGIGKLIGDAISTDPLRILNEQKRFYKNLYQSLRRNLKTAKSISSFLNHPNLPKLSERDKQFCEGRVSAEECYRLLDGFQNNKTPGNDRIHVEFHKRCWHLISDSFIWCVNECFDKGELCKSQKQAVIVPIEKKGRSFSS